MIYSLLVPGMKFMPDAGIEQPLPIDRVTAVFFGTQPQAYSYTVKVNNLAESGLVM